MNEAEIVAKAYPGWRLDGAEIGVGSFGKVYRIVKEDEFSGRMYSALKIITVPESKAELAAYRDDGYDDESLTTIFKSRVADITSEFRLMNKLKGNSHIVSYEDHVIVQHSDDPGYDILIRMELLTPLPRIAAKGTDLEALAAKVGVHICQALELCQQNGIIHRDIKPQNIFVNDAGYFKLGDFGIAKVSDHTTKATKAGTYGYMAPEVYWGKPYNGSVDVYSLGMVLYWLLNERRGPFLPLPPTAVTASLNEEALNRRMRGEPLPAPKNGSEALKRVVLKACAFDPRERFSSAAEMRAALSRPGSQAPLKKEAPEKTAVAMDETVARVHPGAQPIRPQAAAGNKATAGVDRRPRPGQQPSNRMRALTEDETVAGIDRRPRSDRPQAPQSSVVKWAQSDVAKAVSQTNGPKQDRSRANAAASQPVRQEAASSRKKTILIASAAAACVLLVAFALILGITLGKKKSYSEAEEEPTSTRRPRSTATLESESTPMPEPEPTAPPTREPRTVTTTLDEYMYDHGFTKGEARTGSGIKYYWGIFTITAYGTTYTDQPIEVNKISRSNAITMWGKNSSKSKENVYGAEYNVNTGSLTLRNDGQYDTFVLSVGALSKPDAFWDNKSGYLRVEISAGSRTVSSGWLNYSETRNLSIDISGASTIFITASFAVGDHKSLNAVIYDAYFTKTN